MLKAPKLITLTAQASESHNSIKLRNILKWLKSGHEIRVTITGKHDRMKAIDAIHERIQKDAGAGSKVVLQNRKPGLLKMTLLPTDEAKNIKIVDAMKAANSDVQSDDIAKDTDVFSEEFDQALKKSIDEEKRKKR